MGIIGYFLLACYGPAWENYEVQHNRLQLCCVYHAWGKFHSSVRVTLIRDRLWQWSGVLPGKFGKGNPYMPFSGFKGLENIIKTMECFVFSVLFQETSFLIRVWKSQVEGTTFLKFSSQDTALFCVPFLWGRWVCCIIYILPVSLWLW